MQLECPCTCNVILGIKILSASSTRIREVFLYKGKKSQQVGYFFHNAKQLTVDCNGHSFNVRT